MKTTTHLLVKMTDRLEHGHRLRMMQMLCPRNADAEELAPFQDHQ